MTPNADFVRHGEPPGCGKWNCVWCNALPQGTHSERRCPRDGDMESWWLFCPFCGANLDMAASPNERSEGWQRATPALVHRPDCDGHCMDEGECYACYYPDWTPPPNDRSEA